jgi:hypothetical protein
MFYVFPLPLGDAATVVLVAVFLIVFVTTYQVLKKRRLFENPGAFVLAGCVALLSVLGLLPWTAASSPASPENRPAAGHNVYVEFLLLPYAALAISILLVLLLSALGKWLPDKSATPREVRRAKPAAKVEMLIRQRQTAPPASLRARLKK